MLCIIGAHMPVPAKFVKCGTDWPMPGSVGLYICLRCRRVWQDNAPGYKVTWRARQDGAFSVEPRG